MAESQDTKNWLSPAVLVGGIVAVLLLPIGALGSRLGIWHFQTGFLLLGGSAILATICVVGGIVGLILASKAGRASDRPGLYTGIVLSVAILGLLFSQFNTARSVPQIHDISTDVDDPPMFQEIVTLREAGSNPLDYDAAKVVESDGGQYAYGELQLAAYPGVRSQSSALSPERSLDVAEGVLEAMGMDIVAVSPAEGTIEATDTTFWFGFKDDVVVRVRDVDGASLVDVRSVSRVGLSDLGTNAARIEEFLTRFAAAS